MLGTASFAAQWVANGSDFDNDEQTLINVAMKQFIADWKDKKDYPADIIKVIADITEYPEATISDIDWFLI